MHSDTFNPIPNRKYIFYNCLKISFFLFTWKGRDFTIFQNPGSFIRPKENSIFKIHDINGIKLLNRLRLHFSHLNEHKFRHNFRATIDPMCSCALEPEATLHYLLHCNLYSDLRTELLSDVCALNPSLKNLSHVKLLNVLLYG